MKAGVAPQLIVWSPYTGSLKHRVSNMVYHNQCCRGKAKIKKNFQSRLYQKQANIKYYASMHYWLVDHEVHHKIIKVHRHIIKGKTWKFSRPITCPMGQMTLFLQKQRTLLRWISCALLRDSSCRVITAGVCSFLLLPLGLWGCTFVGSINLANACTTCAGFACVFSWPHD